MAPAPYLAGAMPAGVGGGSVRRVTGTRKKAPRASAGGRSSASAEDGAAAGGEIRSYAEWILSSKAARAAFAPSPIEMTICFHGTVVTSPAA